MVLSTKFYSIAKSILKKKTNLTREEKNLIKDRIIMRNMLVYLVGILIAALSGAIGIMCFVVGVISHFTHY